jgi:tRNA threonylcarbamoyladenosine modification (KEOPS) complex  Pcc1 subunit
MDKYWDKIKEEKYEGTFERTTKALLRNQTEKPIMGHKRKSKMKAFILEHKFKIIVAVFLALIVGACNYPVAQVNTVGYAIAWTTKAENQKTVMESLGKLSWANNSSINVYMKKSNDNVLMEFNFVLPGIDENTVLKYKSDLEKIKEVTSIKVLPLKESITRPVYSAALYSFFRVDISSKGKSDAEVKAEIEKQLKDNGFENSVVTFENTDGKHKLTIKAPDNADMKGKNMEVRVDGDGKQEVIKMKTMKGEIDSKMTDEEIKRRVIEDNGGDLKPEEIKIIREGDKIKVEVTKED